jgi:hypothetical protein
MQYFASGLCLAALIGSALYEKHRMKKEEERIKASLEKLKQDNL